MDNLVCRYACVRAGQKTLKYFCKEKAEHALWSLNSRHYPYPLQMGLRAPADSLLITDDVTMGM